MKIFHIILLAASVALSLTSCQTEREKGLLHHIEVDKQILREDREREAGLTHHIEVLRAKHNDPTG